MTVRETLNDLAAVRATYDGVAAPYADAFLDELAGKPLDRALLDLFCDETRPRGGTVADLGTGSGQIARYVHERGLRALGIDLAPNMVAEARRRHPGVEFAVGDLQRLEVADASYAGLTAFYAIVHLARAQLTSAFAEARRVLVPGGALLLAWHVGDDTLRPDDFLGAPCPIAGNFFPSAGVLGALVAAGLVPGGRVGRRPYPGEHPSTRGDVLARRPG